MSKLVKGTMLIDCVGAIKNAKDIDWGKHLQPGDKEFLNHKINDADWYSYDIFKRMAAAALIELGKGNTEVVRSWGRTSMDRLSTTTKSLISKQPMDAMMSFKVFQGTFFNFDPVRVILVNNDSAKLELNFEMDHDAEKAATVLTMGVLERMLEMSGAKSVDSFLNAKRWAGDPCTTLEIEWSETAAVKRVRGSIFVDSVRLLKSKKDADWSKYLNKEDMAFLECTINNDEWYPFDTLERMAVAIINEMSKGNLDAARQLGRFSTKKLTALNEEIIKNNDPMESIMRFHILRNSFFDFNPVTIINISPYFAKFGFNYGMRKIAEEAVAYQMIGHFEMILDLSGAKDMKYSFLKKAWEGEPETILRFTWN